MSAAAPAFAFDPVEHQYILVETGEVIPSITQMLERTGWVDDTWMSEASRDRGSAVHELTKQYDLGVLDARLDGGRYRGYLLAHIAAVETLKPIWIAVEEPLVHPSGRWAGRPDRLATLFKLRAVLEEKSGVPAKSHAIQTALQAMLAAPAYGLPAEQWARFALYLTRRGKYKLEQFTNRRDYDEARRVLKACTR